MREAPMSACNQDAAAVRVAKYPLKICCNCYTVHAFASRLVTEIILN
jgi:hypothetical protein